MRRLIVLFLLLSLTATADIYEYQDLRGNKVFSDRAPANFTNTRKAPINKSQQTNAYQSSNDIYKKSSSPQASISLRSEQPENNYSVTVLAPKDQETFWDEKSISATIHMSSFPDNFKIQIMLDEIPYGQSAHHNHFFLDNISRGQHTIRADLLNRDNIKIATSKSITFFVHSSVENNNN